MTRLAICSTSFVKNKLLVASAKENLSFAKEIKIGPEQKLTGAALTDFLVDVDAAIIGTEKLDARLLGKCPKLKCVAKYGVGLDNIDLEACRQRNIPILHTPGVNSSGVAEHTLGLALNLMRNISYTNKKLHDGKWHKNGGNSIAGNNILIVGCGHIGKKVSLLLKSFGANIYINDTADIRSFAKSIGAVTVHYEEGLSLADIVSFHTPLNSSSKYLFHKKYFEYMERRPWVINTSRGGVVHEQSLIFALQNQLIRGAALDVFENEPIEKNSQLLDFDNVIVTPHIAGNSLETVISTGEAAIFAIKTFFS